MGNRLPIIIDPEQKERLARVRTLAAMSKENVMKVFKAFRKLDIERSGNIPVDVLFQWLGVKKSLFFERTWELVDLDYATLTDTGVSWIDFFCFVVTFCMFSEREILKFLFFLYDRSKSGVIEKTEIRQMVLSMNSENMSSTDEQALEAMDGMDTIKEGAIKFPDLVNLNKEFPHLLHPAFVLQNTIAMSTNGIVWWQKQREKCALLRHKKLGHGEHLREIEEKKMLFERAKLLKKKRGILKTRIYMYKYRKYLKGGRLFKVVKFQDRLLPVEDSGMHKVPERQVLIMKALAAPEGESEGKKRRTDEQKANDERRERSERRKQKRIAAQGGAIDTPVEPLGDSKRRKKKDRKVTPGADTPGSDQVEVIKKKKKKKEEKMVVEDLGE